MDNWQIQLENQNKHNQLHERPTPTEAHNSTKTDPLAKHIFDSPTHNKKKTMKLTVQQKKQAVLLDKGLADLIGMPPGGRERTNSAFLREERREKRAVSREKLIPFSRGRASSKTKR